jgi:hypothetical protein
MPPQILVLQTSISSEGLIRTSPSPTMLGPTTEEGGRPAVVSIQGAVGRRGGFLVAFGQGAGVSLCLLREGEGDCASRITILSSSGNVQQVTASIGEEQADHTTTVGFAWTSSCGTAVQFASVAVKLEGNENERLQVRRPVQEVVTGQGLSWPSIAYSDRAFRVDRTNVSTSDAGEKNREVNGWIVSWVGPSAVRAVRIDADGVRSEQDDEQPRDVHLSHAPVTYHSLHRLMGRDGRRLVSFTATQNGYWLRALY